MEEAQSEIRKATTGPTGGQPPLQLGLSVLAAEFALENPFYAAMAVGH
jgi:hypothetical protein